MNNRVRVAVKPNNAASIAPRSLSAA
jgi:hypothetical protein